MGSEMCIRDSTIVSRNSFLTRHNIRLSLLEAYQSTLSLAPYPSTLLSHHASEEGFHCGREEDRRCCSGSCLVLGYVSFASLTRDE